jgi:hypothetical protein
MSARERMFVDDVEQIAGPVGIQGRLEVPKAQTGIDEERFFLVGWVFGTGRPVTAVEFLVDDGIVERIPVDQARPDVAAAFPGRPESGTSGFRALVETARFGDAEVLVRAALDDGEYVPFAKFRFRRAPLLDPGALLPTVREYDLSTAEAARRYHSSPVVRWAKLIDDDPPPGSAWQRISDNEFFEPLIRGEFTIGRDDRVFAIGSCFARAVETALASLGMDVASRTDAFDHFAMRSIGFPVDFTNKYNTEAIRNELRWALEPGEEFPRGALVRFPDGTFQDPYAASNLEYGDEEETVDRHRLLTEVTRQVSSCRIVVVTLGLIEAFFDTKTGLVTNTTPHLTADPDRFRFRVLSFEQTMEGLEGVYQLLSTHGHPDLQIVVTVSPVPLEATFTGQDVVLANTLSKAVLRAAAGAWTARHANVHYFPSYEIVVNSDRAAVWHKDGRHVQSVFVRKIMDLFVRTHLATDDAESLELAGEIHE